jgi:Xaa-Pro aminopeptidase
MIDADPPIARDCCRPEARDALIRRALGRTNWDLLVCATPANILMLTGYWPGAGAALALAISDGRIALIVPEDEADLARRSWADEITTYSPAPLDRVITVEDSVFEALSQLWRELKLAADRVGFEQSEQFEFAAHNPSLLRIGPARVLRRLFPAAILAPADEMLAELRSVKTLAEIEHIARACRMAGSAFHEGVRMIRAGMTEAEAAAAVRISLAGCVRQHEGVHRCDGFVYCMSGVNTAMAYNSYPRSRSRQLEPGDPCVIHCDVYADGYWAAVTRTYHLGECPARTRELQEAVLESQAAALGAIRPGARGADVDRAAREALAGRGLASGFRHPAGHGAGFGATDHTARPNLHPKSEDVLHPGMVVTLQSGVYTGESGIRHADMVIVTHHDPVVLTNFHATLPELALAA